MAFKFSAQFRNHQTNGLRRAGGVGDDVFRRRPRSAQILPARPVDQRLGSCVGVNCGHGANLNAKVVIQRFRHRRQAVSGAGCDRNNLVAGIQRVVIHVEDNGFHIASRGGNQHFFSASVEVRFGLLGRGIEAGALDNDPGAGGFPRNIFSLFFCVNRNFFAVYNQRVFGEIHTPGEYAVV